MALADDPQSTRHGLLAARGAELFGRRLDGLPGHGVRALHARRIHPTRANIDRIGAGTSGVLVIHAKKYKGRSKLRVESGLLGPWTETLMVGSRDCTKIVAEVHKQIEFVRPAVDRADLADAPHAGSCVSSRPIRR